MSDRTEFDEVKNRYQQHQHLVAAAAGCRQQAEGHAGIVAHAADARAALVALYADQAAGLKVSTKELDKAIAGE